MKTVKQIADEAAEVITECFGRLDELSEELKILDPELLERTRNNFGDESTATFLMFTPHEDLDNKSALQLWAEQKEGPLNELLDNT